jgi:peptidoglycan/xylan/chitin deacetylase (PgdA/CDA1 family)
MKLRSLRYYRDALDPGRFFGARMGRAHVPVFVYHHVTPRSFERHLQFLEDNRYRAVSCDRANWSDPDPREVVLTFDDGRRSVWSVAAPLLKKYGFRATAFVSPGMMSEGDPTPTIEEGDLEALEASYFGNHELFNWTEARLMAEAGTVDLQLHGFAHARVFTTPRAVDFYHPQWKDRDEGIAGWIVRRGGQDVVLRTLDLGQPIYEWGSRWGDQPRYLEDEASSAACVSHVRERGGADFFERPKWREELESVARERDGGAVRAGRLESREEKVRHLEDLLGRAKSLLQAQTGVRVDHFALPWSKGNEMISEVAEAVGVSHVYWEASIPDYASARSSGVQHHFRLKDQFLLRLPGKDRQGVIGLLAVVAGSYRG